VLTSLEIRWRQGAQQYTLTVGEDGVPRLDSPPDGPAEARPPRAGPVRKGSRWTKEEEDTVLRRFNTPEDAKDIAVELGRSRGAVLARAVVLGLVTEEEAGLRYPAVRDA
jgi:hypothetical protein